MFLILTVINLLLIQFHNSIDSIEFSPFFSRKSRVSVLFFMGTSRKVLFKVYSKVVVSTTGLSG